MDSASAYMSSWPLLVGSDEVVETRSVQCQATWPSCKSFTHLHPSLLRRHLPSLIGRFKEVQAQLAPFLLDFFFVLPSYCAPLL